MLLAVLICAGLLAGCGAISESAREPAVAEPSEEQLRQMAMLNQTADDMYQKVMQGDVAGGRAVLQQLGDQIPQLSYAGITSIEGMNALTSAVTEAKRVFNAVNLAPDAVQISAAQIRLATDALTHKAQPMWLQYYKLIQEDIERLSAASTAHDKKLAQSAAAQLGLRISVIHPSVAINRDPSDVEKLDSLISFISNQAKLPQVPFTQINNVLPELRQHIDKLFLRQEATAYLPIIDEQSPILWIVAIGSAIVAALIFAGWRLAKKDGGMVPVRKKDDA
ncbi:hypothetical protein CBW46_005855 [Paenibacillus xerothermodurans]|uniref:Sporulation protein n=2 Tax=Paenibacillus xerothermodurans TaxID=1977292 RepID=A0A2W1NE52_PAEXE|nr:hypothetical protein CBW46_005855 [Paenibacillus xerothermodurans]